MGFAQNPPPPKMPPSNFPLRWESTGDKWWYASPIDWAAANGHYDLVRELLRLDGNHLIKLTSLRRVRRLEAVWDDEEQFHDVAKFRCEVARRLFDECQTQKEGKNSLIVGGYGGWLLYTAASAGDLGFVQLLLGKHPLLVFGEGEYGLTDILYAAARSRNPEVFRVIYDFSVSPRFLTGNGNGGEWEEQIEGIPMAFKLEVKSRAVYAAARGGNLAGLKELLADCSDVLEYGDVNGSTILHAAAGKGQVEVVKYLVSSYDVISSVDNEGNTALHVAAYKGQLRVLEALIQASPSSPSAVNKAGDTFLHTAIAGFQTLGFRRFDRQIELMKQLVNNKCFKVEDIINSRNNEGRTALHLAIIGDIHSDLVELLMRVRYINVNIRDDHGMTPLDYLKREPRSASSDMLTRQLVSAGGISSCKDYAVRKAFASQLKMQGICSSPGTSFRISDNEIFIGTGIDNFPGSTRDRVNIDLVRSSSDRSQCDSTSGENGTPDVKKSSPLRRAAKRLRTMLHWAITKKKETERSKKMGDQSISDKRWSTSDETPISLRELYCDPTSLSTNKRTLAVRSNISSPTNRKKFASGFAHGVPQNQPLVIIPAQSPSSSLSKSLLSTHHSLDKGKAICVEDEISSAPSCLKKVHDDDTPGVIQKQGSFNKHFMNPALCFGESHISVKTPIGKHNTKLPVYSVA